MSPEPHDRCVASGLGDDGARQVPETQEARSPIIAEIIQLWRMRQRWHRAEKSLTLQGKAVCRSWTDGDKTAANALFKSASGAKKKIDVDQNLLIVLGPFIAGISNFESERKPIERRLRVLARLLPIWPWVGEIKGFGDLNLAGLVGEGGDLGSYRNPSCLWKRFGLAVIRGQRQRRVKDKALAMEMGYDAQRRSVAYLLSDCLVKGNKSAGRYRPIYDEHKAKQLARTDEDKPKSQKHAHNRAQSYMVKRVLRDLWAAWRQTSAEEQPKRSMSAALKLEAA